MPPSSPSTRLRRLSSCARSSASERSRTIACIRSSICAATAFSFVSAEPADRRPSSEHRDHEEGRGEGHTAGDQNRCHGGYGPCRRRVLTISELSTSGLWFERRKTAARRPAICGRRVFATIRCPVGRVMCMPRRPLLCEHTASSFDRSRRQRVPTTNQLVRKGRQTPQGEDEDACAARGSAEAGRLHARLHDDPEEAELGAAQGRARAADERDGGHDLHPGRGAQPAGALGRADPRRPRQGPAGHPLQGDPRRARHGRRLRPQAGPLEVRSQEVANASPRRHHAARARGRPGPRVEARDAVHQRRHARRQALDRRAARLRRARDRRPRRPARRPSRRSRPPSRR